MSASQITLLFILYGAPGIAALLFLLLGFAMARRRSEVVFIALLCAALVAVHAGELYFLWGLRQAWGGDGGDPLVAAGAAIAAVAALLTWVFVVRGLRRAAQA